MKMAVNSTKLTLKLAKKHWKSRKESHSHLVSNIQIQIVPNNGIIAIIMLRQRGFLRIGFVRKKNKITPWNMTSFYKSNDVSAPIKCGQSATQSIIHTTWRMNVHVS